MKALDTTRAHMNKMTSGASEIELVPQMLNERIAYFNGKFVTESKVLVPFRDKSFLYGDGAFEMTRTFNHRIFRLGEHLERFYRSLRALRLDAGMPLADMQSITEQVFDANLHLLGKNDDYWVAQRVTGGIRKVEGDHWDEYGPTVIVECLPMPMAERAAFFRDGIRVVTPSIRRTPPDALTPRAKSHNYLNLILADREVQSMHPGCWAVLLDINGNLCEGIGSNIFLVRDGKLLTPKAQFILAGISRRTVIEISRDLGIPFEETDIDLYDAYTADEAFITSTSLCVCPISKFNGVDLAIYGQITRAITKKYIDLVGCDFVQQYLDCLPEGEIGGISPFAVA
ncbi:MAG: aminotransferase class IV [Albidovulum sp.]|nr:aminotransferase class IV [Albidovulum sp.]